MIDMEVPTFLGTHQLRKFPRLFAKTAIYWVQSSLFIISSLFRLTVQFHCNIYLGLKPNIIKS